MITERSREWETLRGEETKAWYLKVRVKTQKFESWIWLSQFISQREGSRVLTKWTKDKRAQKVASSKNSQVTWRKGETIESSILGRRESKWIKLMSK